MSITRLYFGASWYSHAVPWRVVGIHGEPCGLPHGMSWASMAVHVVVHWLS